jgi:hypothetical protein
MMTVWYFDDYEKFENGEKELCKYLQEHGETSIDTVNITEEIAEYGHKQALGSTNLIVTRYESKETSGYFAVIVKPFRDDLENYFIIYYGTNEKPLNEQIDTVKKLMAKEYYMASKNGYVRGLNDCVKYQSTEVINDSDSDSKANHVPGFTGLSLLIMLLIRSNMK